MSVIQSLISEGVIVEYRDFRSGTFSDFSGNDNVATPTGVHLMKGGGARFVNPAAAGTNLISIPNTASYDFGTSTDFSIYAWFKTGEDTSARNMRLFSNTNLSGGVFADINNNIPRLFFGAGATYTLTFNAAIDPTISTHACWVIDRDTSGYTYYNGSLVASTEANPGNRQDNLDTPNPLQLGKVTTQTANMFDGTFNAFLIANRVLTATEVSQIQGELEGMKWPTKTSGKAKTNLTPNTNDSSLVVGYNMKEVSGEVQDFSQNTITGTVNGNPLNATTNMGSTLRFNGVDADIEATNALLNVSGTTELTVACWVKTNITTGTHYCIVNGINTYAYTLSIASNGRARIVIDQDWGGDMDIYGTSALLRDGQWHYLVGSLTTSGANSTLSLYVDGELDNSNTFAAYTMTMVNTGLYIGRSQSTYSDSTFASAEIYNEGKNASWVATQYAKGAGVVQYKTDWGIAESSSVVSSTGVIRDSDFTILSGQWRVNSTSTTKSIYCNSSGVISLPTSVMAGDSKEAAYGTWEFTINKGGTAPLFGFACQENIDVLDGSQNCYVLHIDGSRRVRLRKVTAGSLSDLFYSAADYVSNAVEYRVRITRSPTGVFTGYIKGGAYTNWTLIVPEVGTNPATDNSFTTADYVVWELDTGDSFILSKRNGDDAFIKRVGVWNG